MIRIAYGRVYIVGLALLFCEHPLLSGFWKRVLDLSFIFLTPLMMLSRRPHLKGVIRAFSIYTLNIGESCSGVISMNESRPYLRANY